MPTSELSLLAQEFQLEQIVLAVAPVAAVEAPHQAVGRHTTSAGFRMPSVAVVGVA